MARAAIWLSSWRMRFGGHFDAPQNPRLMIVEEKTEEGTDPTPAKRGVLDAISNIFQSREARAAQAEMDQLSAQLKAASEEFDTVKAELETARAENERLSASVVEAAAEISALKAEVEAAKKSAALQAASIALQNHATPAELPGSSPSEIDAPMTEKELETALSGVRTHAERRELVKQYQSKKKK